MAKISGIHFAEALEKAGIISDLNTIARVIIDIKAGDVIRLHVERIGDQRLLDTVPELRQALGLSDG